MTAAQSCRSRPSAAGCVLGNTASQTGDDNPHSTGAFGRHRPGLCGAASGPICGASAAAVTEILRRYIEHLGDGRLGPSLARLPDRAVLLQPGADVDIGRANSSRQYPRTQVSRVGRKDGSAETLPSESKSQFGEDGRLVAGAVDAHPVVRRLPRNCTGVRSRRRRTKPAQRLRQGSGWS